MDVTLSDGVRAAHRPHHRPHRRGRPLQVHGGGVHAHRHVQDGVLHLLPSRRLRHATGGQGWCLLTFIYSHLSTHIYLLTRHVHTSRSHVTFTLALALRRTIAALTRPFLSSLATLYIQAFFFSSTFVPQLSLKSSECKCLRVNG